MSTLAAGVQSMTGAGAAAGPTSLGGTTVECRSVNGRGLNVKLRLAAECQGLEAALEAAVKARFGRGTLFLLVAVEEGSAPVEPQLDQAYAQKVAGLLDQLAAATGKQASLGDVLGFPGVMPSGRSGPRPSRELPAELAALLAACLDQLEAARREEGGKTVAELRSLLTELRQANEVVRQAAPAVVEAYREKLLGRVNEFLTGRATAMEPGDVIREVAVYADRVDIAEELQRMDSHLDKAEAMFAAGGPLGRNLEFLVQEMLREANTMGSKSPDVEISHKVVEMKSMIDKLKEQAANLE